MRNNNLKYLKDIFVIGLTTFGGPQAHLARMLDLLVKKRKYFTEEEILETYALCQLLPGPGSTQTITAISLKRGGVLLAIISLLVWILPAVILMSAVAVVLALFERTKFDTSFLQFVQPMAIGFILFAGYKVSFKVIKNISALCIMVGATIFALFFSSVYSLPLIMLGGAVISNFTNKQRSDKAYKNEKINWRQSSFSLFLFLFLFVGVIVLSAIFVTPFTKMLENFYRFGSVTFGGGNVLVPMMFEQFVHYNHYMKANDFLSGLAMSQAVPGPSFAFATFAGGLSFSNPDVLGLGPQYVLLGCLVGTVCIFLPSILFVFFVFPFWGYLKHFRLIKRALEGINAAANGLVIAAAFILFHNMEFLYTNVAVIVATFLLLRFTKINAPILVMIGLTSGFIYSHYFMT